MREHTYKREKPQRMDSFLLSLYPVLSMGALHKALRQNKIKLNGKKQPLSARLVKGDTLQLYLNDAQLAKAPALKIVFEDARLLAIDKPAGLPTLAEKGQDSLLARAALRAKELGEAPPLPCHRLDTGTSGLVLFAKDAATLAFVESLIRSHGLVKTYTCVVLGAPSPPAGTLRGWHTKDAAKGIVQITRGKREGAKPVETRYKTLHTGERLALLEIRLVTGRTHQIRAHLALEGHPILGDSKYGIQTENRRYRCKYQCLCAAGLRFPAALPPEFTAYSGLALKASPPWYQTQMLDGTLL